MLRRLSRVAAFVALAVGIAFVAYPFVSNAIIRAAQEKVAKENIVIATSTDDGRLAEEAAAADEYNDALSNSRTIVTDPFDPDASNSVLGEYDSILDIAGDGVMASIEIPEIGIFVPLYHGTSDGALAKGAGHLPQTSLPVGGASTHCVVAGHTGLPSVRIFDDLDRMHEGSIIIINVLGKRLGYEVYGIEVVEPDETDSLAIAEGRDLLTLVTCTPYGVNSHRLLVHAERCELPAELASAPAGQLVASPPIWKRPLVIAAIVFFAALAWWLVARRARRDYVSKPKHGGRDR